MPKHFYKTNKSFTQNLKFVKINVIISRTNTKNGRTIYCELHRLKASDRKVH